MGHKTQQSSSQSSGAPLSAGNRSRPRTANAETQRFTAATLQQEFTEMSLRTDAAESSAFEETDDASSMFTSQVPYNNRSNFTGKRSRRGKGFLQKQDQSLEPIKQDESVVLQPGMFGGAVAQAATASIGRYPHQLASNRRKTRRKQTRYTNADEEGWATEDVTDFKETEFDFQGNLSRFDKKTVFSQIKAEDTTADEARLVSFNRLPRRDKAPPKKNYRHTENVLGTYANGSSLGERDSWKSPGFDGEQSEDTEDEDDDGARGRVGIESGRSSRRAISRQSMSNRLSTRQLSSSNLTNRGSVENLQALSSSGSAVVNRPGKPSFRLSPSTIKTLHSQITCRMEGALTRQRP